MDEQGVEVEVHIAELLQLGVVVRVHVRKYSVQNSTDPTVFRDESRIEFDSIFCREILLIFCYLRQLLKRPISVPGRTENVCFSFIAGAFFLLIKQLAPDAAHLRTRTRRAIGSNQLIQQLYVVGQRQNMGR